jgi:hypothetical protein
MVRQQVSLNDLALLLTSSFFLALTKPRGMLCPNGTVKPFLVSLVEPVAYLKSELGENATNYLDTSTSRPSDSFPGLMAIISGSSPRTAGAFYDVAYDRVLAPPTITTGNGVSGGTCTPGVPNGTTTEYESTKRASTRTRDL